MGYVLRIANNDGTHFLSLLHGGLRVVNYSWTPAKGKWSQEYANSIYGPTAKSTGYQQPLVEGFTLGYSGNPARQRETVNKLRAIINKIPLWHDGECNDPYWLEWYTQGETPKRALLYMGAWEPQSKPGAWPMLDGCVILGQLALTRHPLWEDVKDDLTELGYFSTLGGIHYLEGVPGTAPARIAYTFVTGYPSSETPLTKVWAGIRRACEGTDEFVSVWECDDEATGHGTIVDTDDTISDNDDSCSNCWRVQTDFTTEENLSMRLYVRLGDVAATDLEHFRGKYLVLCRCRCEDSEHPAYLQMRYGYVNTDAPEDARARAFDTVKIDTELYNLYELGEIEIPPPGNLEPQNTDWDVYINSAIFLWASGTADYSLYVDCLVLIPTDFFVYIDGTKLYAEADPLDYGTTEVVVRPNETVIGANGRVFGVLPAVYRHYVNGVSPEPRRWYLPEGDSMIVAAAQRADQHYFSCDPGDYVGTTDVLGIELTACYRWEDYRGTGTGPTVT